MSAAVPASLALFDIGPLEFMVLIGAAVMLFGGDLPDVARKAGRTVRKLRRLASEAAKNLDVPGELSRLPGAAEFKAGMDEEDRDELDLRKQIDIDWREVARLPDADRPPAQRPATMTENAAAGPGAAPHDLRQDPPPHVPDPAPAAPSSAP
ncbi:MAG TPA: twin-arginine translocase TatA/TatE family subunit [Planctomycetota bacterium]|nr:twin-arginine translocase TatA/TatE family subunit [Planctomycetota bacterium]